MQSDSELVERYVGSRDQAAFAEIVARHVDVVYGTAVRLLGGPGRDAEDVVQAVFLLLSQRAHRIRRPGALVAWLIQTTRYCCGTVRHEKSRRSRIEREAAMARHEAAAVESAGAEPLRALLDEALSRLGEKERSAIMVRYLEGKTAAETGSILGISAEAVEKRLERGIGKLRLVFARQGFVVPAAGIVGVIVAESVKAPAALAGGVIGGVGGTGSAAISIAKGVALMMKAASVKLVGALVVAALFAVGVGAVVIIKAGHVGAKTGAGVAATEGAAQPPAVAGPVTIRGVVVDEQGKPVAGVAVDTSMALPQAPGFVFPQTRTAADGRFTLNVAGNNVVSRFLRARTADESRQGFVDRWDQPRDELLLDVKLVLKPARIIAFGVKDGKGAAVAGAKVAAEFNLLEVADSGADGRGLLRVPADASLQDVYAEKPGVGLDYFAVWGKDSIRKDPFHLPADFSGPVNFVLNGARTVTVEVRDEQQRPLAGARVYPWFLEKPNKGDILNFSMFAQEFLKFTDAQGKATFAMMPADTTSSKINFWVRLDGYTSAERWLWSPASGKDQLTATLLKMVHLAGRVTGSDGKPVAGATVRIGGAGYQFDDFRGETKSAADGGFGVDVDPEMYYVLVAQKGQEVSPLVTQMVHKQPAAAPIELKLAPANRVYGTATAGPNNEPVKNLHVSLYLRDDSYSQLPTDERFPGPVVGRRSIEPTIHQYVTTDKDGRFEFYTDPGSLQTDCSLGYDRNLQNFTLEAEDHEVTIHFQNASTAPATLHGRVVRADKPEVGVAKATLTSQPVDFDNLGMMPPAGTADGTGHFEIQQALGDEYLRAASPDQALAAIVLVKPGEEHLTIPLAPAAWARGRAVDESGKPAGGLEINYGIRMRSGGVFMDTLGATVKTGDDGRFVARGLVPGKDYNFSARVVDADGVTHIYPVGSAAPDAAREIDLGDVRLGLVKPAIRPVARARAEESGNDGDWQAAFERAYALGDGENLRYIAPPAMAVRQRYLRETQRGDFPMPFIEWRWTAGQIKRGWMSGGNGTTLATVLAACCKLDQDHVALEGLPAIDADGDWIVRDGATTEALLADLQKILRQQFKLNVRFEKKQMEKEALVVQGDWQLDGADPAAEDTVQVYADKLDHPEAGQAAAGGGSGKSAEFWSGLGSTVGMPVVDEAGGEPPRIQWAYSWSSLDAAHDATRRDQILANVEKQTGLTFKREKRTFTVWRGEPAAKQ